MMYSAGIFARLIVFALTAVPEPAKVITVPQDPDPAYTQVLQERARKIVQTLKIEDDARARQVQEVIAEQYRSLGMLQDTCDAQIKAVQSRTDVDAETKKLIIQALKDITQRLREQLHTQYLLRLSALLSPAQIDQVKDGMTYGLLPVTYNSYLQMLPQLTDEQKEVISAYLIEAREIAMDASSSGEKHQWFGKYKGRINNYLSAQGYDLKKASEERNVRNQAGSN